MNTWSIFDQRVRLIYSIMLLVPFDNISLVYGRQHCRWKAAKFRSKLCVFCLWTEGSLSCHIYHMTRYCRLHGFIHKTVPCIGLYWQTMHAGILCHIYFHKKVHIICVLSIIWGDHSLYMYMCFMWLHCRLHSSRYELILKSYFWKEFLKFWQIKTMHITWEIKNY